MCNCLTPCEVCECELHSLERRYPKDAVIKVGSVIMSWQKWLNMMWDTAVNEVMRVTPGNKASVKRDYVSQLRHIVHVIDRAACNVRANKLDMAVYRGRTMQFVNR